MMKNYYQVLCSLGFLANASQARLIDELDGASRTIYTTTLVVNGKISTGFASQQTGCNLFKLLAEMCVKLLLRLEMHHQFMLDMLELELKFAQKLGDLKRASVISEQFETLKSTAVAKMYRNTIS